VDRHSIRAYPQLICFPYTLRSRSGSGSPWPRPAHGNEVPAVGRVVEAVDPGDDIQQLECVPPGTYAAEPRRRVNTRSHELGALEELGQRSERVLSTQAVGSSGLGTDPIVQESACCSRTEIHTLELRRCFSIGQRRPKKSIPIYITIRSDLRVPNCEGGLSCRQAGSSARTGQGGRGGISLGLRFCGSCEKLGKVLRRAIATTCSEGPVGPNVRIQEPKDCHTNVGFMAERSEAGPGR